MCSLDCSGLHRCRKKMLNIHVLIVFWHFAIQWWISLSMRNLRIQFNTYLIGCLKHFFTFCHIWWYIPSNSLEMCFTTPLLFSPSPWLVCLTVTGLILLWNLFNLGSNGWLQSWSTYKGGCSCDLLVNKDMNLNDMIVALKNMSRVYRCAWTKWDTLITSSPRLCQCTLKRMLLFIHKRRKDCERYMLRK